MCSTGNYLLNVDDPRTIAEIANNVNNGDKVCTIKSFQDGGFAATGCTVITENETMRFQSMTTDVSITCPFTSTVTDCFSKHLRPTVGNLTDAFVQFMYHDEPGASGD